MLENYMVENAEHYDRQYAKVFCRCENCNGEIYKGEEYIEWRNEPYCCDECLLAQVKEEAFEMVAK